MPEEDQNPEDRSLASAYSSDKSMMSVYSPGAEQEYTTFEGPIKSTDVYKGLIDDQTASDYLQELKGIPVGTNPEREKFLDGALFNYAYQEPLRQRRDTAAATRKEEDHLNGLYTDPGRLKALSEDPAVRAREELSLNPNLEKMRLTNRKWLELKTGMPIDTDAEYEMRRNQWSSANDGVPEPSDSEFFQQRTSEYEQENILNDANRKVVGRGIQQIALDAVSNKPTELTTLVDEIVSEYPDLDKSPGFKADALRLLRHVGDTMAAHTDKIRPQLAQAIPLAQRIIQTGGAPEDITAMANVLNTVDFKTGQELLQLATYAVTVDMKPDERHNAIRMNEAVFKNFFRSMTGSEATGSITAQEDSLDRTQELLNNGQALINEKGVLIFSSGAGLQMGEGVATPVPAPQQGYVTAAPQGRPLTADEFRNYTDRINATRQALLLQRQIRFALENKWDPVQDIYKGGIQDLVETGLQASVGVAGQLAPQLPMMFMGGPIATGGRAILGVGAKTLVGRAVGAASQLPTLAYSYKSNFESIYDRLIREHPNEDRNLLRQYARNAGLIMAPFDLVELAGLTNKLPFIKNMVKNMSGGKLVSKLGHFSLTYAGEELGENTQNFVENFAGRLYDATREDKIASGDAWSKAGQKAWEDTKDQMPETLMAMFPFALVGSGVAHAEQMRADRREAFLEKMLSPESMQIMGFSPEQIDRIVAIPTTEERAAAYNKEYERRDPKVMKAAEAEFGRAMRETRAEAEAIHEDPMMPTWHERPLPDGKTEYTVTSPSGEVYTTTDEAMADAKLREQIDLASEAQVERMRAEAEAEAAAAASDEGVAREAEAKAEAETVSPEDRLGTAMTVEFEENAAPTPEESRGVAQLQADVAAQGRADVIVLARPSDSQAGPGQASLNFIRAFERATGKRVVFVASGNDQPLSFTGAVRNGDPNTIFLDAHGDRNVLALVGHEWSHTLEQTSPELHAEMIGRMKPLIIEWAKQEGILAQEVGAENVTNEMVANIVGDAISNENFWTVLAQKNPSLFEKVRDAVLKFLDQFIGKAQKSEFGTEAFITDVAKMREIVADIMHRAGQGAEAPAGAEAGVVFAPRVAQAIRADIAAHTNQESVEAVRSIVNELSEKFQTQGVVDALNFTGKTTSLGEAFGVYEGPAETEKRTGRSMLAFNDYVFRFPPHDVSRVVDGWSKDTGTVAGGLRGLVAHEYGHVLHNLLRFNRDDATLSRMQGELKALQESVGNPSEYAKKRETEWLAEQLASEFISGKDGPATQWLKKELNQVTRQQVQFANRRTEKGFYSKLEDFVSGPKIQKVSSPDQVKATINGAGIKAEEIKWSGVMPKIDEIAAENAGKVPKEKLVTHLEDEGSVKFEEVTLSMDLRKRATQEFGAIHKQILEERGLRIIVGEYASDIHLLNAERRIVPVPPDLQPQVDRAFELSKIVNQEENVPRYEQYVLPGGENYREVVLAMPEVTDQFYSSFDEFFRAQFGEYADPANPFHAQAKQKAQEKWEAKRGRIPVEDYAGKRVGRTTGNYTSSHFPNIPNYVAHMRLNEREGGLFIEEIQSDRHQAGREKGYVEPEVRKRQQELLDKPTLTDAEVAEIEALSKTKPGEIPDAPFRSDWHIAMFKRALRDAVATGQSWIGWTTGQTQFKRWGSEKFDWERLPDDTTVPHQFGTPEEQADAYRRLKEATDAVSNTPTDSTGYPQAVEEHRMAQQAMIDIVPGWGRPEHYVKSWRLSGQEQFEGEAGGVNMEQLARERGVLLEEKGVYVHSFEDVLDVVRRVSRDKDKAKGMAEKLWKKMQEKDSGTSLPRKEGMEYFYDTALPSVIGKYVSQKPWGGKVEQGTVSSAIKGERKDIQALPPEQGPYGFRYGRATGQWSLNFATLEEAQAAYEKEFGQTPIWKVEITPQMKAGVTEGQVMFAGRRKTDPSIRHHADIVAAHRASVAAMNGEGGGSTVNAVHGSLVGTKNYSVAVFPELSTQIPGKHVTVKQIAELADKAKSKRIDTTGERISIGTWYDKENDTTWLDVVMTTADRERALDLAKQYNQKAIFDLENIEEITTGGTGEMVGGLPPIKARIEAINNPTRFALAELEQFAKDNEDFKNWYDEFSRFLDYLLKEYPEYKPIVSEFLAATSANTPLKKNVESTIENLRSFILEGKFVTKFEAHLPNLGRATRGEKLQGPKIGEFSGAVFGDVNSIAIDTHMAQIIFGARRNDKGQIIGPTDAQIRVGKEVVRQIASRLRWTPAQAQAALWAANLKLIGKYDPNYRYERYLEEHRQELLDILAQDRAGEGRGREASRRIGERIREGAGTEAGAGPELGGEAQPRADTTAQGVVSGSPQKIQQELGQLAPSQKEARVTPKKGGQVAFAGRRAAAVEAEIGARMVEPQARVALFQKMRDRVLGLIWLNEAGFPGGQKRIGLIQAIAEYNAMLKVLPPEIRGRVGQYGELTRIGRSEEALAKFFTRAIARIDEVLERQLKTEYRERIETLLKDALPKKGASGVVKSRVGPDAQALVARVLPYTEMSGEDVEARSNQIELILGDSTQTDNLSPEQISKLVIEQEELNQYGALKEQSAESLAATHAALKQTLKDGRSALSAKEEIRLADQRAKAEEITRRLPAASQAGIKAKNQKVLKNFFSNFLRSHYSLAQMLGQVIPNASFLEKWQDVSRRQTMADYDFVLNTTTELSKIVRQALGKNSSVAAGDALAKMKELTIVGPKGKVSKLDAIHYVMAWKQRDVQTRMEGQGWTKEHINALNAELSDPVSQALMGFFRQKYDSIYQKTNEVYRRMYGMDLPKNPNYVPMRYEHGALELESDPTGGPLAISGLTPSAIKGRVAHNSEMQQADALDVFLQHLNQMSHWLHTAELNREMRGVLTNVEAKKALKQHLGQDGYQMVLNQMDAIARNGSARAGDVKAVTQAISFVASGKAITALAFNLHSLVMQFDSAMRFMLAIPASRWVPLLANPKTWANFSTAWHSDTVQRRIIGGMAPDVQFAMQINNLTPSSLLALTRAGMLPINYADAFATSVSSAIVYTDAINQGASHEVALDRMDAAVARFSQPTVLSSKSGMEVTSSAALKLFMMFMSDARLKTGILWEAIGDIRNGKNIGMAIQRILVVEAMSLLSQLIASVYAYMLSDDDDDQEWYGDLNGYLRALFAAPLQGLIFVGSIAEATASWVFGTKMFPKADPFVDLANKFRKAGKHLPDITRPFEDPSAFLKEIDNLAKATGSVSGPMAGLPALVGQAAKWTGEIVEKTE